MLAFGVPPEGVALGKARVAKLALVGLLSGVHPLMALELTCLPEALGTDGAHKVPLACVDVLVSLFKTRMNIRMITQRPINNILSDIYM